MKNIFFLLFSFILHLSLNAQWQFTHGPFGSNINDLEQNDHYVFAATPGGIYRSEDLGKNWKHLPFLPDERYACLQIDVFDSLIIADAVEIQVDTILRHMYKSINHGNSWTEIPRPIVDNYVSIGILGTNVFAADFYHVWTTQNDGVSWQLSDVNNKIEYPACFHRIGSKLYIGFHENLFITEGDDHAWQKKTIPTALEAGYVFANDNLLLVRDYYAENLYISEDAGSTWFNTPGDQWDGFPNYFVKIRDTLFATGYEVMYTSSDNGHTWSSRNSKGMDWQLSLIAVDTLMLSGYGYAGMFRSDDFGRHFNYSSEGIDAAYQAKLTIYNGEILAGGLLQGVFNYNPKSKKWKKDFFDEYLRETCHDMKVANGKLLELATGETLLFEPDQSEWITIYPNYKFQSGIESQFFQSPSGLLVGGYLDGYPGLMGRLTNNETWELFTIQVDGEKTYPYIFTGMDDNQFIVSTTGMANSSNAGEDWVWLPPIEGDVEVKDLIFIDDVLFKIPSDDVDSIPRLEVSFDKGQTWTKGDNGIETGYVQTVIDVQDYFMTFSRGIHSGIYYSKKDEINWHPFNEGLPAFQVRDLVFDGKNLYAAINARGVWSRDVHDLQMTFIVDVPSTPSFRVYPNPVNGRILHVNFPSVVEGRINLCNLIGQVLKSWQIKSSDLSFELNLPLEITPGMYIITFVTGNHTCSEKIIISSGE